MANLTPTTPTAYLAALPEPRRMALRVLHRLIRQHAPILRPHLRSGMLGYGAYHYRYPSGREGDWFVIGLASQRNYISLYVCAVTPQGYLAEEYRKRLPKANIGKSCVRFRNIEDVDLAVIGDMITRAAELGGAGAVS
ncbi:DUF1801 domain-containing protein [Candidatus Uhrbacteria bacterium]|nr:DUF1801 domain-containing protein [Candidatus Uhrbacteria bacterium]